MVQPADFTLNKPQPLVVQEDANVKVMSKKDREKKDAEFQI